MFVTHTYSSDNFYTCTESIFMCLFMRENVCQSWKQTIKTISFYIIKWNPSMRQIFHFLPSAFMQVFFFLQFSLIHCDVFVLFYLVNIKILRLGLCTFVLFCNIVVLDTLPMYWCNKWQSITLLKMWLEKSRTISIEIWIRTSCTLQWNIRHFTDPPESKLCLVVLDDKLICFLHFSSFCSFFSIVSDRPANQQINCRPSDNCPSRYVF